NGKGEARRDLRHPSSPPNRLALVLFPPSCRIDVERVHPLPLPPPLSEAESLAWLDILFNEPGSRKDHPWTEGHATSYSQPRWIWGRGKEKSAATAARDNVRFPLGKGFRNIIIGLTQRAASTARSEPRIQTGCVESVAAGQTADFVVIFKSVKADSAGIARSSKHLGQRGSTDGIIFIVIVQRVSGRFVGFRTINNAGASRQGLGGFC
ncbi:hypothetical protein LTR28_000188, partial [Elasticomyces elasticus]